MSESPIYGLVKDALRQAERINLEADTLAVNTNASLKTNLIQLLEATLAKLSPSGDNVEGK